eukprot:768694-Hanusia_phi.AAC.4
MQLDPSQKTNSQRRREMTERGIKQPCSTCLSALRDDLFTTHRERETEKQEVAGRGEQNEVGRQVISKNSEDMVGWGHNADDAESQQHIPDGNEQPEHSNSTEKKSPANMQADETLPEGWKRKISRHKALFYYYNKEVRSRRILPAKCAFVTSFLCLLSSLLTRWFHRHSRQHGLNPKNENETSYLSCNNLLGSPFFPSKMSSHHSRSVSASNFHDCHEIQFELGRCFPSLQVSVS